jgi:hypothetical protein
VDAVNNGKFVHMVWNDLEIEELEESLDDFGRDGWEVVSVVANRVGGYTSVLKKLAKPTVVVVRPSK